MEICKMKVVKLNKGNNRKVGLIDIMRSFCYAKT